MTYWVGETQQSTDYQDLKETPDAVTSTTHMLAINTVHLARRFADHQYPPSLPHGGGMLDVRGRHVMGAED